MKILEFSKLDITNFRNINEMSIDFGKKTTIFKGRNKIGKTNILSSIMWCLFGKSIYDEKQFPISPIINGIEDNSINTNVKLVINNEYVISRTYKDRKTTIEVGFIDSDGKEQLVAMTQTQYLEDLKSKYVDEETFKSLSNTEYITNMHWKELKELVFELIGNIKDEEVLLREDFGIVEELIKNFGIDTTIDQLNKTDKELKEDIKRLETEYQTTLNMKEKYVSKNEESEKLITRKKEIEVILSKTKEEEDKNNKLREEEYSLRNKVDDTKRNVARLENEIDFAKNNILEYQKLYDSSANSVEELREKELTEQINLIRLKEKRLFEFNEELKELKEQLEAYKREGNELKAKEVKVENSTCPTCKQALPEEMINETLKLAKEEQLLKINKVKEYFDFKKQEIKVLEENIANCESEITKETNILGQIKVQEYEIVESERQKQLRVAKETKEIELKEIEKKLDLLKKELPTLEKQYESLEKPKLVQEDNLPYVLELDDINTQLATTTTLSKLEEDLESIKKDLDTKKDNTVKNKEKQQLCIKFNNIKADLLKQKVSKYFKVVNFRTKELTLDGQEVETFKITNENNVSYDQCSFGEKIGIGLELVNVIQDFKEIRVPILLDELTAYSGKLESNSQIIGTFMDETKDKINVEVE